MTKEQAGKLKEGDLLKYKKRLGYYYFYKYYPSDGWIDCVGGFASYSRDFTKVKMATKKQRNAKGLEFSKLFL